MANPLQLRVVLPRTSGITADTVTNTFNFRPDAQVGNLDIANLAQRVINFYTVPGTGQGDSVGKYLAQSLSRTIGACQVQVRDITIPNQLPTIFTFTLPAPIAPQPMPAEVSICASMLNNNNFTAPVRNRRGRVYLGPLQGGLQINTNNEVEFTGALINIVNASMKDLKTAVGGGASNNYALAIYSPTTLQYFYVTNGFCDKAPDIQRRRGIKSQGKVSWT